MSLMQLIEIKDLSAEQIEAIWERADRDLSEPAAPRIGWSFDGKGIRTRTTFMQAFQALQAEVVELPGLLQTQEPVADLSGYLDPFYDLYVIREPDHQRLREFAAVSSRPVINAMSAFEHPCEVLTDAYWLHRQVGQLTRLKILLWGPMTNVFRSWHALADVLSIELAHCVDSGADWPQSSRAKRVTVDALTEVYDVVITDGWPAGTSATAYQLTVQQLDRLGRPVLLPTPPVQVGRELAFPAASYSGFAGYEQKQFLLPVQRAIIEWLLSAVQEQQGC